MPTPKKPTTARASAFSTTNRDAAFNPPQAVFNNTAPTRRTPGTGRGAAELSVGTRAEKIWGSNPLVKMYRKDQKANPKQRTPGGRVVPEPRKDQAPKIPSNALQPTSYKKPPAGKSASSGYWQSKGGKTIWIDNEPTTTAPKTAPKGTGYTWTPPAGVDPTQGHSMTVKKGDTLWALAKRAPGGNSNKEVQARLDAILAKNPQYKSNPNLIKPSDVVTW